LKTLPSALAFSQTTTWMGKAVYFLAGRLVFVALLIFGSLVVDPLGVGVDFAKR